MAKLSGVIQILANTNLVAGHVYNDLGEFDKALEYYEYALDFYLDINDKKWGKFHLLRNEDHLLLFKES